MKKKFLQYIQEHSLFSHENKLLVAFSGGIDSMVLIHLLYRCSFIFEIAHCNFGLRGKESDKDEVFIKKIAQEYAIKYHSIKFETQKESKIRKLSVQTIARELRYNWFEEKRKEIKADFVLTAHHADDDIETLFLNLIRGTGIKGLLGIPRVNGQIIRPLLFTHKQEINKYAHFNKLKFRQDSSNNSKKYLRNKIRHDLIPLIKSINPNFCNTFIKEKQVLEGVYRIYQKDLDVIRKKLIEKHETHIQISLSKLKELSPLELYLHELFNPFGFSDIKSLFSCLFGDSGKQFFSDSHRILIDREFLIITPRVLKKKKSYKIKKSSMHLKEPILLDVEITDKSKIKKANNIANLDFDKLKFPLTLRPWKEGDRFMPFGMNKYKKLSDFFIDNKLSIIQKESIWVLCSDDKIIWIVGMRIDNRYKITEETKKMYIATLSS